MYLPATCALSTVPVRITYALVLHNRNDHAHCVLDSGAFFKIKLNLFLDTLIQFFFLKIIKINDFRVT